jgi:hypothetical protein
MAERCLRTQLISLMLAPDLSSAAVIARFSASVTPAAGAASKAEPPPEISASTRSCVQALHLGQNAQGRRFAGRIRHRVRRLDNLDAFARHAVAVARDDQTIERPGPMLLDRPRHCRRGLAGTDHDQPPAVVRRQIGGTHKAGSAAAIAASNRRRRMSRGVISAASRAQAGLGRRQRLVFAADPAVVAQPVEQLEQEGIIDFAGARLMPAGVVGDLDMADPRSWLPASAPDRRMICA